MDSATAANGLNLIWVGSELISFTTATPTGANAYNLTGLYRGLYGTTPGSHSSGATWAKIDSNVFRYQIPVGQVGATLYIKLVSWNIWGGGKRSIGAETAYTFTPAAAPLPAPTSVSITIT